MRHTLKPGPHHSSEETDDLLRLYARTRNEQTCETLLLRFQPLVVSLAARFLGRGEPGEDLLQVANLGLVKALGRFDGAQGLRFSTFAVPTILGELRRHFRDRTDAIRIPRPLVEREYAARKAAETLEAELSRPPTTGEVAECLGVSEEQLLEAMASGESRHMLSLDAPLYFDTVTPGMTLQERVGGRDPALESIWQQADLQSALVCLEGRERAVLLLRFVGELSQREVAEDLGVSQMQVSRLQTRALQKLRARLKAPPRLPQ